MRTSCGSGDELWEQGKATGMGTSHGSGDEDELREPG